MVIYYTCRLTCRKCGAELGYTPMSNPEKCPECNTVLNIDDIISECSECGSRNIGNCSHTNDDFFR